LIWQDHGFKLQGCYVDKKRVSKDRQQGIANSIAHLFTAYLIQLAFVALSRPSYWAACHNELRVTLLNKLKNVL
jgi:hypothetical protein